MTDPQKLRKALLAWNGKDRVRQLVLDMWGHEDAAEDLDAIDQAMDFIEQYLKFSELTKGETQRA